MVTEPDVGVTQALHGVHNVGKGRRVAELPTWWNDDTERWPTRHCASRTNTVRIDVTLARVASATTLVDSREGK
jgi:hypothetical protein